MTRLSLALFGRLQLTLDDRPLTGFESVKVRALLAYLVVEAGCAHRREALATLLWPELPGEAARTYLRQALANLREVLHDRGVDPAFLLITRETIQFNLDSEHRLDIADFTALLADCARHQHRPPALCARCADRLEAAAELYRGPLLDQFFLGDSPAFEEWAALRREALHQQALGVLTRLAHYHDRRGACDDVRRVAWRQLELDPWREEAHQLLMQALWQSGERSAALAQYRRCREALHEELGVEPAAETTALFERIRAAGCKPPPPAADGYRAVHQPESLPPDMTPFIGREAELAALGDLIANAECRLLTLVGPGGIGKTRVAGQLAREHHAAFTHGAAFVPLAAVREVSLIVPAIANALRLVLHSREEQQVQLLSFLCDKELLLILDNFEQLTSGGAFLIELLQQAPGVTLLVTSRERLLLREEWAVELAGLQFPAGDQVENLEHYSGARLFLETACRVQGGRPLPALERRYVPRICRQLDGMPLAIELAASWVRVLPCAEIAAETERSLSFLSEPAHDMPEHHRSMRAVFDRSWCLLSSDEQSVLRQLAVFRGGWERDAALEVAGARLTLLAALVDKSLVRRAANGRYELHELVRQYAEEQLPATDECGHVRDRHLQWYLRRVEEQEQRMFGTQHNAVIETLELEHDNLRAALQWALDSRQADLGLRLSGALWWFWRVRGHVSEGRKWLSATLAANRSAPSRALAKALHGAGWLAAHPLAYDQAVALLEQSFTVAILVHDTPRVAAVIHDLGQTARVRGDNRRAVTLFEKSATLGRELGDRHCVGRSLGSLGAIAHAEGDNRRATELLEAGLSLMQELGDNVFQAWWLAFLGRVAKEQAACRLASCRLGESLRLFRDALDNVGIAFALEGFAGLMAVQGKAQRAARLFGAAEALRTAISAPMVHFDQPEHERDLAAAREQLSGAAFAAAYAEGQAMSLEQAIACALDDAGNAAGALPRAARTSGRVRPAQPLQHQLIERA